MLWVALLVCAGWIASVCLHEFGHALVAYWGGDTSVKDKGYLTLNPLKYTDPTLSLLFPLIFLVLGGIALPGAAVYINHAKLRNRWWQSAVSAAGPIASILVAVVLTLPFWTNLASVERDRVFWAALAFLAILQISVTLLNLLPIPPLDGYGIIEPWLPTSLQQQLNQFGKYGLWVIFGLFWFVPQLNQAMWQVVFAIATVLSVPLSLVDQGSSLFRGGATGLLVAAIAVAFIVRRFTRKPQEAAYERGNHLTKSGRYAAAIAAFDQAIALQADFYEAWRAKGTALTGLQQYDQALAAVDQALELKPDDPLTWMLRSWVLGEMQQYDSAIAACDRAIELQPNYADAWYNKACYYAMQHQLTAALDNLKQAIQLDPFRLRKQARTDVSFANIREEPGFKKLTSHKPQDFMD